MRVVVGSCAFESLLKTDRGVANEQGASLSSRQEQLCWLRKFQMSSLPDSRTSPSIVAGKVPGCRGVTMCETGQSVEVLSHSIRDGRGRR